MTISDKEGALFISDFGDGNRLSYKNEDCFSFSMSCSDVCFFTDEGDSLLIRHTGIIDTLSETVFLTERLPPSGHSEG